VKHSVYLPGDNSLAFSKASPASFILLEVIIYCPHIKVANVEKGIPFLFPWIFSKPFLDLFKRIKDNIELMKKHYHKGVDIFWM